MNDTWTPVTDRQARQHVLHGVGGWLIVMAAGLLLVLGKDMISLVGMADRAGLSLLALLGRDDPEVAFGKLAVAVNLPVVAGILGMMIGRPRCFRAATSMLLAGSLPLITLLGAMHSSASFSLALDPSIVMPWAVASAASIAYLHRSRRVRVTFEQRVDAQDARQIAALEAAARAEEQALLARRLATRAQEPQLPDLAPALLEGEGERYDEFFWSQAWAELEGRKRRHGLWARSLAQTGGDDARARIAYLIARVRELDEAERRMLAERRRLRDVETADDEPTPADRATPQRT